MSDNNQNLKKIPRKASPDGTSRPGILPLAWLLLCAVASVILRKRVVQEQRGIEQNSGSITTNP